MITLYHDRNKNFPIIVDESLDIDEVFKLSFFNDNNMSFYGDYTAWMYHGGLIIHARVKGVDKFYAFIIGENSEQVRDVWQLWNWVETATEA